MNTYNINNGDFTVEANSETEALSILCKQVTCHKDWDFVVTKKIGEHQFLGNIVRNYFEHRYKIATDVKISVSELI